MCTDGKYERRWRARYCDVSQQHRSRGSAHIYNTVTMWTHTTTTTTIKWIKMGKYAMCIPYHTITHYTFHSSVWPVERACVWVCWVKFTLCLADVMKFLVTGHCRQLSATAKTMTTLIHTIAMSNVLYGSIRISRNNERKWSDSLYSCVRWFDSFLSFFSCYATLARLHTHTRAFTHIITLLTSITYLYMQCIVLQKYL